MGHQELDVPAGPQVADARAAQVAEEAHVGDEDAGDKDKDEWRWSSRCCMQVDAEELRLAYRPIHAMSMQMQDYATGDPGA